MQSVMAEKAGAIPKCIRNLGPVCPIVDCDLEGHTQMHVSVHERLVAGSCQQHLMHLFALSL